MSSIKVWIIEDDPDWLRGLTAFLNKEQDIEVIWTESDARQAQLTIQTATQAADVILMDIMMDGKPEGIELADEASRRTGARVIMLTSMEEKELIFRSFQAGAIDYQIKSDFESLPAAVRAAYAKQSTISAAAAEQMREEFRRLKLVEREFEVKKMEDLITPSELQLLNLIDQGYSQSQIADKLVVSLRTVKNHVNHILKKLRLPGSKEAAKKVKDLGLLNKDDDSTK
ncbi:response regulator [Paenibacillus harenae]|uniref:response regulator n=1 Tax=Paenibacillus harenae TaxID=306543 RepID=UPI00278DC0FB|nr:response regulator transcription factor [Paenibacillus harenae]MDQ0059368.1 two-component system vancomycin resistance associated response regulator VraR [Paenibacillus harenae]